MLKRNELRTTLAVAVAALLMTLTGPVAAEPIKEIDIDVMSITEAPPEYTSLAARASGPAHSRRAAAAAMPAAGPDPADGRWFKWTLGEWLRALGLRLFRLG